MNDILQKVKTPAIALLIAGIINGAISALSLVGGLFRLLMGFEKVPVDEAQRIGFFIGTFTAYGIAFLSLITAPIIIYGAVQMMSGKKYSLAKTASILAIIPLTSCCFILGMPLGIWAFITLRNPEVKAFFNDEETPQSFSPPQPPNFS